MFNWLCGKFSRWDWLTCEERMLKLMKDGEWISTDTLQKHLRDYRDAKYKLGKKWYIFDKKPKGKNRGKQKKWTQYMTFYRLVGKTPCVPPLKWKRGYMKDFTTEELISELWARWNLDTMVANGNVYHILSNYDDNSLTPPCVCNNSCCQ